MAGLDKLEGLDPDFRVKAERVLYDLASSGRKLRIIFGLRDKATNDDLVDQGLATRDSKHLDGKALDVIDRSIGYANAFGSTEQSHTTWNNAIRDAAAAYGLAWGGDFYRYNTHTRKWEGRWDPNHVQAGP
ncbi:MAG: hypothetical protein ACREQV_01420 [Candidatus Binatia bacterium]